MKTIGIIAEFNPFHNGHKYLIEKAKKITNADNVVIVCSGNFVQRGTPAIFDKSVRTTAALLNGADVVLELPVIYSTASAETFAHAAVKLLDKLNCIDYLCFGCETDNIKALPTLSKILLEEPADYKNMLAVYLKNGFSYPKARAKALTDYCNENHILNNYIVNQTLEQANNILALEYLKALKKFHSKIKPLAIKRVGSSYSSDSLDDKFASATGIRKALYNNQIINNFVPENCNDIYKHIDYLEFNDFSCILGYQLIKNTNFASYYDINEELSNRIKNLKTHFFDIESFINELHSKNYTYSGLSRALSHILLNITENDMKQFVSNDYFDFVRVLGFRKDNKILTKIKEHSSLDIISKFSTYYNNSTDNTKKILDINIKSDELYRMVYMNKYGKMIPTEFERQICIV
ncbi:MAG: nucleotidyltransferase [Eubacterium sp.]|nr:nucleotidyltransferase [Eubacterium sp.]